MLKEMYFCSAVNLTTYWFKHLQTECHFHFHLNLLVLSVGNDWRYSKPSFQRSNWSFSFENVLWCTSYTVSTLSLLSGYGMWHEKNNISHHLLFLLGTILPPLVTWPVGAVFPLHQLIQMTEQDNLTSHMKHDIVCGSVHTYKHYICT